jgi:hypothetical protein
MKSVRKQVARALSRDCVDEDDIIMETKLGVTAALAFMALAGCQQKPPIANVDRVITVAEFKANPQLRREILTACANNPGESGQHPNCINVKQAERSSASGSGNFGRLDTSPPASMASH